MRCRSHSRRRHGHGAVRTRWGGGGWILVSCRVNGGLLKTYETISKEVSRGDQVQTVEDEMG